MLSVSDCPKMITLSTFHCSSNETSFYDWIWIAFCFTFSDDVRSSLDLLDRVIGEFDDGLLSSTESESPITRPTSKRENQRRQQNDAFDTFYDEDDDDESHIEAEIRRQPPPKGRRTDKVPTAAAAALPNRRTALNEKIDDIFSELTEEVYQPPDDADRRLSPGPPRRPPTAVAPKNDTTR